MDAKERRFALLTKAPREHLVPAELFYHYPERTLDLSSVLDLVHD